MEKKQTNDGKKGGWLVGKRHYSKDGKPLGGIKAVVTDAGGKPVELEGGEVIINREASRKHWKELSRINQSAGNGVAIEPPSDSFDEDPEDNYEHGGKIDFNPNHIPSKKIVNYAKMIKSKHPEIWKLGGNIFGNEAFENLLRVSNRGYWIDSEEWMYIKWRSYVARHQRDYRIEGVVAMLKWCDKVGKGWPYMKQLIEEKIEKIDSKKALKHKTAKMKDGGSTLGRTPAPLKDRIKGSKFNEKGSASTSSKASDIKFDDNTIKSIQNLINEHNEEHPSKKITLAVAKAVVRRGMGAYSSSHRPTISGGKPNSRTAWGLARLKAFIYKAQTGKSKSGKYSQDNDLFEELGISVQKMAQGGVVEFNKMIESEYLKTYKEDYDSIEKINSIVAMQYLQQIAIKNGFSVGEVEFVNESKNPKNHFQMTMYTYNVKKNQDVIIYTAPFVYVDDKHKVVQSKTKVELLNSDWETIKKDIRYKDGGNIKNYSDFIKNTETILTNGYYLDLSETNNYMDAYGLFPLSLKGVIITYNSGGQKGLKCIDTINVDFLNGMLEKLFNLDFTQANIVSDYYIKSARRFDTLKILPELDNKNVFIIDRDAITYKNIKMKNGGKVENGASESYNILKQHLDEYCQYHFNERLDGDSFMIKTIKNGNGHKVQELLGTTKSGRDIRISIDQLYMKNGGSVDAKDTVTLNIPLLIRTLELAREDIKSDAELHEMVERLLDLKNKPELTMDDYAYIADIEHKHLKPKMELGGNTEIEKDLKPAIPTIIIESKFLRDEMIESIKQKRLEKGEKFTEFDREFLEIVLLSDLMKAIGNYLKPTDKIKDVKTNKDRTGITISTIIYRDDEEFPFHTDVIVAGGYNIQTAHYRYLVKTKIRKESNNPEYDKYKEKIKKLSKIERLNHDMKYLLQVKERYESEYQDFLRKQKLTDDEALKELIAEEKSKDGESYTEKTISISWDEIVKRGADKNYDYSKEKFLKSTKEYLDGKVSSYKKRNESSLSNLKKIEKDIEKKQKQIDGTIGYIETKNNEVIDGLNILLENASGNEQEELVNLIKSLK